jgi:uncharacterized membrane protein (UPF0127 family)
MSFLSPLVKRPSDCVLRNARTGQLVATRLELAADSRTRRRGLLGRAGLDEGHALVIVPCGAIHTFFMRFSIDVVFVAKDGRVVKCAQEVRPWRLAAAVTAHAAIELPAGTLQRSGTARGDRLVLEETDRPFHGRA